MPNLTPVQAQWLTLAFVVAITVVVVGYDVLAILRLGSRVVDLASAPTAFHRLPHAVRRVHLLARDPGRAHRAADGVMNRW